MSVYIPNFVLGKVVKPKKYSISASESDHQKSVIEWAQRKDILRKYPDLELLFHIPNGGSRNKAEAANLKLQGVKSGVPDLTLPVAKGQYHGLFVEMKKLGGTETKNQAWWRERLLNQGYLSVVCHSCTAAIMTIEAYLNLEKLSK